MAENSPIVLSEHDEDASDIVENFLSVAHADPRAHLQSEIARALVRAYEKGHEDGEEKGYEEGSEDGEKDGKKEAAAATEFQAAVIELLGDLSDRGAIGIETPTEALDYLRGLRDEKHRQHLQCLRDKRAA